VVAGRESDSKTVTQGLHSPSAVANLAAAGRRPSALRQDDVTKALSTDSGPRSQMMSTNDCVGDGVVDGFSWSGNRTKYPYDAAGQVLSIVHANAATGAVLASFTYGYDLQGNRINKTREDGALEVYKYDSLQRLAEAAYGSTRAVTYALDPLGNRQALSDTDTAANGTVSSSSVSSSFNTFNQLTAASASSSGAASNTAYAYDGNGNTLSQTTTPSGGTAQLTSFVWDLDNRLREMQQPSGINDFFAYDANGLRVQKVDSSGTTNYLLDGPSVVEDTAANSSLLTSYLPGLQALDDIVSFGRGGATYYPLSDALGSIVAVTDSTGTLVAAYTYDVYGARTQTTGALQLAYGYTGREHDADTGLIYQRDRYRAPATGRWLQADRAEMVDGPNLYLFALANPIRARDPSGQAIDPLTQLAAQVASDTTLSAAVLYIDSALSSDDPDLTATFLAYAGFLVAAHAVASIVAGDRPNCDQATINQAKKLGINVESKTSIQLLNNWNTPVREFIAKYRLPSILQKFPREFLDKPLGQALSEGTSTVLKLLKDTRFAK
jgi:RHS repeat-associated protein